MITSGPSPYFFARSTPIPMWVPSCSWSTDLPISWRSAHRRAIFSSSLSSAAIAPARNATSLQWPIMLCPKLVRYFSFPTSRTISGCILSTPTSLIVRRPSSSITFSIFFSLAATTSSTRPGLIRPSRTSCSIARRATSRLMGSKLESTTASGVSFTITLTPVTASKEMMLRPSLPTMRPLMSSSGRATTEIEDCTVWSVEQRSIAFAMIR